MLPRPTALAAAASTKPRRPLKLPLSSFLSIYLNFAEQNSHQRIIGRSILEKHIPLLFSQD